MARDTVNIISMNSARRCLEQMSPSDQYSYLQQLIERAEPDICFLPGDNNKHLGKNVVVGYEQYKTSSSGNAVLLYDSKRVNMNRPNVSFSTFGHLPELDIDKLVTPMVEVLSLLPAKAVVKEFTMISWERDLFSTGNDQTHDSKVLESLIKFSQMLAMKEQRSIFIGGEIPVKYDEITSTVKRLSQETNNQFLKTAHKDLKPKGYMQSMTSGSTTILRHKFKLEVFRCKQNSTWSGPTVSDCFIASKELQLTEAKMMQVEDVLGRQVTMTPMKEYAPVQTEIKYENRLPRHHGG